MKKILTTLTLFSLVGVAFAQTHNEQVTVIAPYRPTVMEAYKIHVSPKTIDSSLTRREARYDILSRKVMTSFGIDNIRPAKVAGEPISKLSPLHIRAGYGNYNTPYAEVFYGNGRSAKWQYGAHLKHESSQGTFKNHQTPFDNSTNEIDLFGGYSGKKILLSGDFSYDRKRYTTYGPWIDAMRILFGPDAEDNTSEKVNKRIYNAINGNLQFSDNNTEPNSLGYSGKIDFSTFQSVQNDAKPQELSLAFDGNIHHTFDFNHPFFNQTIIGIDAHVDWIEANEDEFIYSQGDMLFPVQFVNPKMWKFHPYGKLRFSGHDFSLGLRVNAFNEFNYGNAEIEMAAQWVPTVHAKFNLIDNLFAIEFGMDGNAEYATMQTLAKNNPFISSFDSLQNPYYTTQLYRNYYLELHTALSKTLDFSLKGELISYKNLLNFDILKMTAFPGVPLGVLPFPSPFFEPTYQDINRFLLQADLNYHLDEKISVSAMGRLNSYDDDILYKPKYEANLQARYSMQNKIILKTQLYFATGVEYQDYSFQTLEFQPTIDWSLGAEYRYDRRWSAFLELNNILNRIHYDWYNYRTYRMKFMVGITFTL